MTNKDATYDVYKHKRYIGAYTRSDLKQMGIKVGKLEQDIRKGTVFEGGYTVKPEGTEKARKAVPEGRIYSVPGHVKKVKLPGGCRFKG